MMLWSLLRELMPPIRVAEYVLLLLGLVAFGTVGFMVLGEMTLLDALYQTVTTLTTVGFEEVKPFDGPTKAFTIMLIVAGVATFFYTGTIIVQEALEGDFRSKYAARRRRLQIEELEDHYILCGFGRVGREIARELRERGEPFVIIENNEAQAEAAIAFGYLVIQGDAADERALVQAGVERARTLFAASDSDSGNTYITLTARSMNAGLFIVARAGLPFGEEKLRLAGADAVISPYNMAGRRMVLTALQPLAADFMDTLAAGRHGDMLLVELEVTEETGLPGKRCADLSETAPTARVLGIRKRDGTLIVGPGGEAALEAGDIVIVLAEEADIERLAAREAASGEE
jgi:voltage-gated potassium channel